MAKRKTCNGPGNGKGPGKGNGKGKLTGKGQVLRNQRNQSKRK